MDRAGQNLGNYHLTTLLGQGGFAEVYLGEHIYLKTQAAIKLLKTRIANPTDMESFVAEAQIVARLTHPNIVRILDFGVDQETPFLVMDYAPNGTLRQIHRHGELLPLPTVVSYVKQIAEALQYAHTEKLIHRDVKPENMLVGRRNEILLSDFGIALVAQSSHNQSTQDVIGTVAYMSPEQIQGKPRPASDQYSLAIVVYEWLSGVRPFNGSFTELCTQHMFAPVPPLRAKIPTIAPEVEIAVNTALSKDPKKRFGNIQAFATALTQAGVNHAPQINIATSYPSSISPTIPATPGLAIPVASPPKQTDTAHKGTLSQANWRAHHLPAWLRAEIKDPPPVTPIVRTKFTTNPDQVNEERRLSQSRAEQARQRHEMALNRQSGTMRDMDASDAWKRRCCLIAWFCIQVISLVITLNSVSTPTSGALFCLAGIWCILSCGSIGSLLGVRHKSVYHMQMTLASLELGLALIITLVALISSNTTLLLINLAEMAGIGIGMRLIYWMAHQHWETFQ